MFVDGVGSECEETISGTKENRNERARSRKNILCFLFPSNYNGQISAVAIVDDLSQVAVGFANGSVTIIRGDLIHDRGARQRIVFESEEPITGLETQIGAVSLLYISTTSRILTLVIAGRGQGQPARVLEDTGCALGCMTLDQETGQILIAREDAIYNYGPRGRGPSYAFESPKTSINAFHDYVALVCPPKATSVKADPLRRYGVTPAEEILGTTTFTLLDTDLKFIAHTESLLSPMKRIFVEWGDLFLLTTEGKVCHSLPACLYLMLIENCYSFTDIARKTFSNDLRFFTSAIFTFWPSILPRRLGLILCNKTLSIDDMGTSCTNGVITTRPCSSTSGQLIILNPHRSFEK